MYIPLCYGISTRVVAVEFLWILGALGPEQLGRVLILYQSILMIKYFHKLTHSDPYVHADIACKSFRFYLFLKDLISSFLN